MKKVIVSLLLAVLLVGAVCAAVFAYTKHGREEEIAVKHAPLLASLKDAGSVQFRNEHFVKGYPYLCGEVNAKNEMGGYVGFTRYVSHSEGYAIDGAPTASFYADSKSTQHIIENIERENALLERKLALMKKLGRSVTDVEINTLAFNDLWALYCIQQ